MLSRLTVKASSRLTVKASPLRLRLDGRGHTLSTSASREGAGVGGSYVSWLKQWLLQPTSLGALGSAGTFAVTWYAELSGLPAQVKQLEKNIDKLEKNIDIKIDALSSKIDSRFDSLNDFKTQLLIRVDKSENRAERRWFG